VEVSAGGGARAELNLEYGLTKDGKGGEGAFDRKGLPRRAEGKKRSLHQSEKDERISILSHEREGCDGPAEKSSSGGAKRKGLSAIRDFSGGGGKGFRALKNLIGNFQKGWSFYPCSSRRGKGGAYVYLPARGKKGQLCFR